jgi:MFS family permease
VHRLADQHLAQHRADRGLAVAAARERRAARALEGDVAAPAVAVDHLAEQQRAAVAELRREAAELVAGVGLGDRLGALGQCPSSAPCAPVPADPDRRLRDAEPGDGPAPEPGHLHATADADTGIAVSDFTLAIAVQNLAWGLLQPLAGAWAVRLGMRRLMVGGALLYIVGLVLLATTSGLTGRGAGRGRGIGAALACNGSALALARRRARCRWPCAVRCWASCRPAGSLGAMIAAPIGQAAGAAARLADRGVGLRGAGAADDPGGLDRRPRRRTAAAAQGRRRRQARAAALGIALRNPLFVVMALTYFVCGMQLVFLTTHLPSYLDLCGMDPMLSAQALGMIGGFNVLGSLFFGWAGGRWNKLVLLGCIYTTRSLVLAWYFMAAPTPTSTLVFAGIMGFLWLGVAPLVSGWIADTFGLRWQAMLGGVAFVCHQIGSFVGASAAG